MKLMLSGTDQEETFLTRAPELTQTLSFSLRFLHGSPLLSSAYAALIENEWL